MYMIRLLIVGESSVGKTSLLIRFNEGELSIDYCHSTDDIYIHISIPLSIYSSIHLSIQATSIQIRGLPLE